MIPWNRFEVFFLKIPCSPISYLNSSSNLTKFQKISRKYLNSLWIRPVFTIILLNSLLIPQIGKFGIIFDTRPCEIDDLAVSSRHPAVHLAVVLPCVPGGRSNIASDAAPPSPCRRSAWLPPCLASWYRPDAPALSRLAAAYRPAAASSRRVQPSRPAAASQPAIMYRVSPSTPPTRIAVNAARALPAACSRPAHALLLRPGIISPLTSCFSFSAPCPRSAAAFLICHRPCHRRASLSRRTLPRPAIVVRPAASHRPCRRAASILLPSRHARSSRRPAVSPCCHRWSSLLTKPTADALPSALQTPCLPPCRLPTLCLPPCSCRRPVAPTTHLRPAWCGERGRRRPAADADANALLPKPTLTPFRYCSAFVWPFLSSRPSLPRRLLLSSWPSRPSWRHPLMSLSLLILWSLLGLWLSLEARHPRLCPRRMGHHRLLPRHRERSASPYLPRSWPTFRHHGPPHFVRPRHHQPVLRYWRAAWCHMREDGALLQVRRLSQLLILLLGLLTRGHLLIWLASPLSSLLIGLKPPFLTFV